MKETLTNPDRLIELSKEYGTPLYVFDDTVLQQRISFLRSALPKKIQLCYAVKANTFIIPFAKKSVERLEACSAGEVRICLDCGAAPESIVVSGVNKDASYIEELISSDLNIGRYTVESLVQFNMLLSAAEKYNKRIPLLLRLSSGSQFGMSESDLYSVVEQYSNNPLLQICGIQYFSGTQKTSIKRQARELRQVTKCIEHLRDTYGFTCDELEFGTGFPVMYFGDDDFDEDVYMHEFNTVLTEFFDTGLVEDIILEIGRNIAASCGTYLTSVVDTKHIDGINYAIADGGMNHIVYYGQSLAMRQPPYSVLQPSSKKSTWTVCGSLCSTNDIMIKQSDMPDLEPGSVLSFAHTGAYCMTEGISLFLSRDLPQVCLLDQNSGATLVRKGIETYTLNNPIFK